MRSPTTRGFVIEQNAAQRFQSAPTAHNLPIAAKHVVSLAVVDNDPKCKLLRHSYAVELQSIAHNNPWCNCFTHRKEIADEKAFSRLERLCRRRHTIQTSMPASGITQISANQLYLIETAGLFKSTRTHSVQYAQATNSKASVTKSATICNTNPNASTSHVYSGISNETYRDDVTKRVTIYKRNIAYFHVTLSGQIVNLVGTNAVDHRHDVGRVSQVSVVQKHCTHTFTSARHKQRPHLRLGFS
jgi:hypothetical protein